MAGKKSGNAQGSGRRPSDSLTADQLKDMYTKMNHIRAFEEKVAYFFSRGMVHGTTHLYVGEEGTAVGALAPLSDQDLITSTHRGHGHTIAKGIDLNRMMAELLGRTNGYCKGKGGSMHIADLSRGNLGANGIVGGGIPIAVGAALTLKLRKQNQVVVSFFGDGALNEGSFHESLNLASVWDLPVVFVCEDNQYAMSMSRHKSINIEDLSDRAKAYGIPGKTVDGQNVFEVYDAMMEAIDHAKQTGPVLLVSETYRYMGHSKSDANRYRTKEEINEWKQRDPIAILRKEILARKVADETELEAIESQAREDIEAAVRFAEEAGEPDIDDIINDVYA
ncbi:MAG: thiamine pyrophosphate-dependent dehydrogenase E1 component subunit alpha [Alkalispirochaeta sp.]